MSRTVNQNAPTWEAVAAYIEAGEVLIVGIDEVGRGALAGPVVAAAVILPPRLVVDGARDSKLVPPARRLVIDRSVRRQAFAIGIGWVSSREIDEYGLSWAVNQSGRRAIAALDHEYHRIMLDGKHNYLAPDYPSMVMIKADQYVMPVAAASIVAKVARDRYMKIIDRIYPRYGFGRHVGYGTAGHLEAIGEFGPSPVHRLSFAPLKGRT